MTRTILITSGISLIRDDILDKEALRIGFRQLPGLYRTLGELHTALTDNYDAAGCEDFNPQEKAWVDGRQGLIKALDRLWHDPNPKRAVNKHQQQYFSGAELASLTCLGQDDTASFAPLQKDDRVVLLASDTAAGIFCAHVIQEVLRKGTIGLPVLAPQNVMIECVTGLRLDNADRFLAQGLPGAARILWEEERESNQDVLLITTGGYKGLLPYLTPVAMHLDIPLLYLYEETDKLLEIQPLPIEFKLPVITRESNQPAFKLIYPRPSEHRRRWTDADIFWDRIHHPSDRETIRAYGLVEERTIGGKDKVRLSATGILAWQLAKYGRVESRSDDAESPLIQ